MYNDNKYTKISIDIKNKWSKEIIEQMLNRGMQLGLEFETRYNNLNLPIVEFILSTGEDKGNTIYAYTQETGFEIRLFNSKKDGFSLTLSRFANFFKTTADAGECNELAFDTAKYLEILLYLCEELVIEDITVQADSEIISQRLGFPVQNTFAACTGSTYVCKSPYYYISKIINNIMSSGGTIFKNNQYEHIENIEVFCKELTDKIISDETEGIDIYFSFQNQNTKLRVWPVNLVITPLDNIKKKITFDAQGADVGFYTTLLLHICKGIYISDFASFFNRFDNAVMLWYAAENP